MHRRSASSRRALLIDGMGTLITLAPPAVLLVGELQRRFGVDVSESQASHALAAEIAFYRMHMGNGRDSDSLRELRRRCAAVLRDALPAALREQDLVDALLASLRFEPFDDAREALLGARAHGARVVVVSNWDVSLAEVLERVGLAPLLDGVVTSAAVGAAKPAPMIFAHALAIAGVPADRATHVGDSVDEDVAGARAAGIEAVLLRRDGGAGPDGVRTIPGLSELFKNQG
jgi:putative hydrolase of the HAD superfamily